MREGHQDMSFEIVDALINDQHFAIEAGVGIGKSFGYLVPVLLYSERMHKPVIIATSTIALQEQLWRDVRMLMPLLGLNKDVILAKGQSHYLCNKRANEFICDSQAAVPDILKEGLSNGHEERKDFPEGLPQCVWDKVNVQRFSMKNCSSCDNKCKYYNIRVALRYTYGVVLCNQDFLTQHLMKLRRGQGGLINSATTERLGQGMLIWIEQHGSNTELVYCPKNTREIVRRLYFNGDKRTILTSATLTNATSGTLEEQYSYFISNTGFPTRERGCLSEPKPSPYPYNEHAMIYYCDDLPHPTREHEAFIEQGVERLLEVLSISNGKALVLFTAKADMEEVYSILSTKKSSVQGFNSAAGIIAGQGSE